MNSKKVFCNFETILLAKAIEILCTHNMLIYLVKTGIKKANKYKIALCNYGGVKL